jgi:phosphoadenosine phosphosulfate reductase
MPRHPGLDPTYLAARRAPRPTTTELPTRIRAHLDAHDGYVALSGGKDSLVTAHLAVQADPNVPVVFFDSGLEYPETYTYLAQLHEHLGLQLQHVHPHRTALQVLVDSGTWDHDSPTHHPEDLHQVLIAEPAARAHLQHGPGELWGVRASEAHGRRMLYASALRAEIAHNCHDCCPPAERPTRTQRARHGGVVRRTDTTVAYGPVWDWTTDEVWAHIARHQLPVNPVYAKLRRLGAPEHAQRVSHMVDGTGLEQGRLTWLRRGWPDLFDELAAVLPRMREFV